MIRCSNRLMLRHALVPRPRFGFVALTSGMTIAAAHAEATVQLTARHQGSSFWARFFGIRGDGGLDDWDVVTLRVGDGYLIGPDLWNPSWSPVRSVPGRYFTRRPAELEHGFLVTPGTEVAVEIRYTGDDPRGKPFFGFVSGDLADADARRVQVRSSSSRSVSYRKVPPGVARSHELSPQISDPFVDPAPISPISTHPSTHRTRVASGVYEGKILRGKSRASHQWRFRGAVRTPFGERRVSRADGVALTCDRDDVASVVDDQLSRLVGRRMSLWAVYDVDEEAVHRSVGELPWRLLVTVEARSDLVGSTSSTPPLWVSDGGEQWIPVCDAAVAAAGDDELARWLQLELRHDHAPGRAYVAASGACLICERHISVELMCMALASFHNVDGHSGYSRPGAEIGETARAWQRIAEETEVLRAAGSGPGTVSWDLGEDRAIWRVEVAVDDALRAREWRLDRGAGATGALEILDAGTVRVDEASVRSAVPFPLAIGSPMRPTYERVLVARPPGRFVQVDGSFDVGGLAQLVRIPSHVSEMVDGEILMIAHAASSPARGRRLVVVVPPLDVPVTVTAVVGRRGEGEGVRR